MQGVKRKRDKNFDLKLKADIVEDLMSVMHLRKETVSPGDSLKFAKAMRHCAQLLRMAGYTATACDAFLHPFKVQYNPDVRPKGRKTRDRQPVLPTYIS